MPKTGLNNTKDKHERKGEKKAEIGRKLQWKASRVSSYSLKNFYTNAKKKLKKVEQVKVTGIFGEMDHAILEFMFKRRKNREKSNLYTNFQRSRFQ